MRHPNERPKAQPAVFAAWVRALEILRHLESKLSIRRSFMDWAFCGPHTNANVGNIRKGVKEGIHFVDYMLAGSFAVWQSKTILARSCEADSVSLCEEMKS
jgi:hypothetical protein